jgi:anti-sigma factor RsiW
MEERERCGSCAEDLSAYLDDELDAPRFAEVHAHLASCADCRARLDALRRVDAELAALPAPTASADLRHRLAVRLDAEAAPPRRVRPPRRRHRWTIGAGIASAAAAALVLYLAVGRGPRLLPVAAMDLDTAPAEEIAIALELDTIEDLEVIANLELLEALLALEEETG